MEKNNKDADDVCRCRRCHRKLFDPVSKQRGVGKICAGKELANFYNKNQIKLNGFYN